MEEIIKTVDKSWNKDLIIRALYVRLAPQFQRDLRFFLSTKEEQKRFFDTDYEGIKKNGVCTTTCRTYKEIFEGFQIECEIIVNNRGEEVPHSSLIVRGSHDNWYFIDPFYDLWYNQAHMKSRFFAPPIPLNIGKVLIKDLSDAVITQHPELARSFTSTTALEDDYLKEMDLFLGHACYGRYTDSSIHYDGRNDCYFDDYFLYYSRLLASPNLIDRLRKLKLSNFPEGDLSMFEAKMWAMNNLVICKAKIPGPYERKQFYSYAIRHTFNHEERKTILSYGLNNSGEFELQNLQTGQIYFEADGQNGKGKRLVLKNQ